MKTYRVYWTFEPHKRAELETLPSIKVGADSEKEALGFAWQQLGKNPVMTMVKAVEAS